LLAAVAEPRFAPVPKSGSPSKEQVLGWLQSTMKSEFGFSDEDLDPSAHLIMDLDLDSIDLVDLTAAAEETFDFDLPEEDLKSVRTLQDAADAICNALLRQK
jgi:acyl carrier protein